MKTKLIVILLAFLVNVLGEEWILDQPELITSNPKQRSVSLSTGEDVLPERLTGIGSPKAVRDHIVRGVGLGLMRVYVGYGFEKVDGGWLEIKSVKATASGYNSYEDCLIDVAEGLKVVLPALRNSTNLPSNGDVYAILKITYFNDMAGETPYGVGLWIVNKIGPLSEVSVESTIPLFGVNSPYGQEKVVIPLPELKALYVSAKIGEQVGTMRWAADSGVQLSSTWPNLPKENTTAGYLYLNGWVARGTYPLRIQITAKGGEVKNYDSTGEQVQLTQPSLQIDKSGLHIQTMEGSNLRIYSSVDNVNWTEMVSIPYSGHSLTVPIDFGAGGMKFFKATAW